MASDREARMDALLDRDEIHRCLVRMSRGSDRNDRAIFLTGFHPDAMICAGPFVGSPEELFDWSSAFQAATYGGTQHTLLQHHCELDGDSAHTETYYVFVGTMGDNVLQAGGRYIDRFEKRDGRWGLVVRNNAIEWTTLTPAIKVPLPDVDDMDANGPALPSTDDLSYIRPLVNRRARNIP